VKTVSGLVMVGRDYQDARGNSSRDLHAREDAQRSEILQTDGDCGDDGPFARWPGWWLGR
jgi:hypothetical protein